LFDPKQVRLFTAVTNGAIGVGSVMVVAADAEHPLASVTMTE
jgi:hypothetical protein